MIRRVIAVAHHPPFRGLNFPREGPPTPDELLWDAFAGNVAMEEVLAAHADRVAFAFCGHTHRARIERIGRQLVVNPGAAGPGRFRLVPSVGRLTIEDGEANAEILAIV